MNRFVSLFSGFGGAALGARLAGLTPVWGVDREPRVVGVARRNGFDVTCSDIREVNFADVPPHEVGQASPECTRVSDANANKGETKEDTMQADAVVRYLHACEPAHFVLENVRGYEGTESLRRIRAALDELGYDHTSAVLCAADYGTPQTRRRLILTASRIGRAKLPTPTHAEHPEPVDLFGFEAPSWNGWYDAIADLLPGLSDCDLAPWQRKRLPGPWDSMLVSQNGYEGAVHTLGVDRALLIQTGNSSDTQAAPGVGCLDADAPANTVYAKPPAVGAVKTAPHVRTVRLSSRCLARFQDFPDDYWLPEAVGLACLGIGNAWPPRFAAAVLSAPGSSAP
ncbi:MAG: DNA cytosine methyltransferase [Bacteroidota bacterium]